MKKILIVVDYQNDFVSGTLGFKKARKIEMAIADKIKLYRESNCDVAFTFDCHGQDYLNTQEGKLLPISHCIKDGDGIKLYGKIAEMKWEDDKSFYKPSFGSAGMFEYLKASNYDTIELVGVVSNICVISNAVLAKTALPEAKIIVDAKCTASSDENLHLASLDVMAGLQIQILNR